MNNLFYRYLFLIIVSQFLGSCAMIYLPNMSNVPLHKEAGSIAASANAGFTGSNFMGSYAVNNSIFINANGAFANKRNDSTDFNKSMLGELAVGYYKVLDSKKTSVFETSAGYGLASVRDRGAQGNYYGDIGTNYHKFFIQPSIGAATDYFDGALTARMVMLKYFNYTDYINPAESLKNYPGYAAFFEPMITARAGYKFIKLQFQFGVSVALTKNHPLSLQGLPLMGNIGIFAQLNPKNLNPND